MIPNPTPDSDKVVAVNYPNHGKLLYMDYLLKKPKIRKPRLEAENWDPDDYLSSEFRK